MWELDFIAISAGPRLTHREEAAPEPVGHLAPLLSPTARLTGTDAAMVCCKLSLWVHVFEHSVHS